MGRKSKCTPARIKKAFELACLTPSFEAVMAQLDIPRRTAYVWKERASRKEEPYESLMEQLEKGWDVLERQLLEEVRAGNRGWQSKAWLLERAKCFNGRWAKPVEFSGDPVNWNDVASAFNAMLDADDD